MLRSVDSLTERTIHATDGDIGHVHDFYFDDEDWTIRYLVVDTGIWLPGRKVLIFVLRNKFEGKTLMLSLLHSPALRLFLSENNIQVSSLS